MPLNVGELQATMDLDISKFTKGMNSAKDQLRGIGVSVEDNVEVTEDYADSLKDVSDSAGDMSDGVNKASSATKKQKEETEKAKKKNEEWKTSIDGVKKAWGYLKAALGAIGIATSITAIISKLKEFIEDCNEAARTYNDFVQSTQSTTASVTVTAQVEKMAVEAAYNQDDNKYTYDDYAKAMASLSKRNEGLIDDQETMTKLSDAYLRFAEVAGKDVLSAISSADEMFAKWNIDAADQADYLNMLYQLYGKTDVPLSDMVNLLAKGDEGFKLMGLSAEEAAGWIATVFSVDKNLDDVNELISQLEKLTKTQYSIFGSSEQQAEFVQRIIVETSGMDDQAKILTKIDEIYREMFPTMETDAETGDEINTNLTEMAGSLLSIAKLSSINPEDISSIMESSQELDSLEDIAATTEQQTEYTKSIYDLINKKYALENLDADATLANIKLLAENTGQSYIDLIADTTEGSLGVQYWKQLAARYKTYEDYVFNNPSYSNHFTFDSEEEWQANKDEYTRNITVVLEDKTSDGVAASTKNNYNAVESVNNPA